MKTEQSYSLQNRNYIKCWKGKFDFEKSIMKNISSSWMWWQQHVWDWGKNWDRSCKSWKKKLEEHVANQYWIPTVFRALRQHCIKNRNDSVMVITAWDQGRFQKSLSVSSVHCAIHKCRLKLSHAKRKPYVNMIHKRRPLWAKAFLKWTEANWKSVVLWWN